MSGSSHKSIALGITGGIAAYKSAELARLLIKQGFEVRPIMTPWATKFIGPLTLEALCGHRVRVETPSAGDPDNIEHIALVRESDLLVIAPLTANTMAKMAQGMADNFLTSAYLAHQGPTLACPAMNTAMLEHPATQRNLATLASDGVTLLYGEAGELACKEVGAGRMAEPAIIADKITRMLAKPIPELQQRRVLVSAGPTCEDLDPVRYLTNRSSGKMGVALARAFQHAGAEVTLVHGPMHIQAPLEIKTIAIRSAEEMAQTIIHSQAEFDIIVMAAAVADYRPIFHEHKLKKGTFSGNIELQRTTDILAQLGKNKPDQQHLIGFAAESQQLVDNAKGKLKRKNLSLIFANPIDDADSGFAVDQNQVLAIAKDGKITDLGKHKKTELAHRMVQLIASDLLS